MLARRRVDGLPHVRLLLSAAAAGALLDGQHAAVELGALRQAIQHRAEDGVLEYLKEIRRRGEGELTQSERRRGRSECDSFCH